MGPGAAFPDARVAVPASSERQPNNAESARASACDNAGMPVEDVAARIVGVLRRAESLFAAPDDVGGDAAGHMGEAAAAGSAVAARSDELSGAAASAHHDLIAAAAQRLQDAAHTDERLLDQLAGAGSTHADGRSHAGELRGSAAEIPARLGPWAGLPSSDLAALTALRARRAAMQRLLASHSEEAIRVADEIRTLGYQP